MTEAEWRQCREPERLLDFLRETGQDSHRKCGLFGCACVRRVWALLSDPRSRQGAEAREEYLDVTMPPKTLSEAMAAAQVASRAARASRRLPRGADICAPESGPAHAAFAASLATVGCYRAAADTAARALACASPGELQAPSDVARPPRGSALDAFNRAMSWEGKYDAERAAQADLVRDIFGPAAFRRLRPPDAPVLRWNGGTAVRIAQGIHDEQAFERMPILADALLDAACDNEDLLAHCREPGGVHARGCWVLDLLLGKQ
jgi:hypothetical protein